MPEFFFDKGNQRLFNPNAASRCARPAVDEADFGDDWFSDDWFSGD